MVPQKILVVDDSKLIHRMFDMMLRQFPLVHALDGREGLQALADHPEIDLILLDINMPVMNGLEFLAEVKRTAAFTAIPVVIISTQGKQTDTKRALEAGATAFITKPFRSEEITEMIGSLDSQPTS